MKTQKKTQTLAVKAVPGLRCLSDLQTVYSIFPAQGPPSPHHWLRPAARSLLYAGRCSCQPARLPIPARSRTRNGQEEVACCPPGGPVALPAGHVGSGAPQGEPQDHRGSPR